MRRKCLVERFRSNQFLNRHSLGDWFARTITGRRNAPFVEIESKLSLHAYRAPCWQGQSRRRGRALAFRLLPDLGEEHAEQDQQTVNLRDLLAVIPAQIEQQENPAIDDDPGQALRTRRRVMLSHHFFICVSRACAGLERAHDALHERGADTKLPADFQ